MATTMNTSINKMPDNGTMWQCDILQHEGTQQSTRCQAMGQGNKTNKMMRCSSNKAWFDVKERHQNETISVDNRRGNATIKILRHNATVNTNQQYIRWHDGMTQCNNGDKMMPMSRTETTMAKTTIRWRRLHQQGRGWPLSPNQCFSLQVRKETVITLGVTNRNYGGSGE